MKEFSWKKIWDPDKPWYRNLFGMANWRDYLILGLVLFGAWAYHHDVGVYQDFYETVASDTCGFCGTYCPVGGDVLWREDVGMNTLENFSGSVPNLTLSLGSG